MLLASLFTYFRFTLLLTAPLTLDWSFGALMETNGANLALLVTVPEHPLQMCLWV